jgi:hypothetical protein
MSRLNRRSKVVSIRLSTDEYTQLRSLCITKGVDSFSELARAAMKEMLAQHKRSSPDNTMEARVGQMDVRVIALGREIAHMLNLMGLARPEEGS